MEDDEFVFWVRVSIWLRAAWRCLLILCCAVSAGGFIYWAYIGAPLPWYVVVPAVVIFVIDAKWYAENLIRR